MLLLIKLAKMTSCKSVHITLTISLYFSLIICFIIVITKIVKNSIQDLYKQEDKLERVQEVQENK